MSKKRLDSLLVERGLAESRSKAQGMIMAGEVMVNGSVITKAGMQVSPDAEIALTGKQTYVSRGGLKLEHALKKFNIDVSGLICLDIGASTGGFTDCLLQHGAARVYALDVGYGQLDYRLRQDSRVVVMDRVNAHYPFDLPEPVDLAVVDVSFISLTKVLPNVLPHVSQRGSVLALFKPQFEAERNEVGKGGIIRDPVVHARAIARFVAWMNEQGLILLNLAASAVPGSDGNREFFFHIKEIEA